MTLTGRPTFPFTAIVGQERMKRALVLNAINPRLGGVLIRGEKGTAKSTAVRALPRLLPPIEVVTACPFGCGPHRDTACDECQAALAAGTTGTVTRRVPMINLPVGATEDRVAGTIDIEEAISKGRRRFEPGLLASANRGILYVDEVNLLNDHLVDIILDAAAMGMNYVEREGISVAHPAQFILVGTMNPEEGDLRPQLLDRFALAVEVEGTPDRADRAEVVRRRIAFEANPVAFAATWDPSDQEERDRIGHAQSLLPSVFLDERMLDLITHLCCDLRVDGLRADIVMHKAAVTLAAYAGRSTVTEGDVRDAAELALLHRRRRQPFEQPALDREQIEQSIKERRSSFADERDGGPPEQEADDGQGGDCEARVFAAGTPYRVHQVAPEPVGDRPRRPGRRTRARSQTPTGQYVAATMPRGSPRGIALDATIRAAAPYQPRRRADGADGPAILLRATDIRQKVRESRAASLILFAIDASGSMAARSRMEAAKECVLSLLLDAYQKRDRVGLIAFRGAGAELLLPPTSSVDRAERRLQTMPTGGRTPLAHALQLGLDTVERHRRGHPEDIPLFVIVSDGRPNVPLGSADVVAEVRQLAAHLRAANVSSVVVDTEHGPVRMGMNRDLSHALGGRYMPVETLRAGDLLGAVRAAAGSA